MSTRFRVWGEPICKLVKRVSRVGNRRNRLMPVGDREPVQTNNSVRRFELQRTDANTEIPKLYASIITEAVNRNTRNHRRDEILNAFTRKYRGRLART